MQVETKVFCTTEVKVKANGTIYAIALRGEERATPQQIAAAVMLITGHEYYEYGSGLMNTKPADEVAISAYETLYGEANGV